MGSPSHSLKALKRPDAVLFDWDDTLFNHEAYANDLGTKLIHKLGHEPYPTADEMNALWHKDKDLCCKTYFSGRSPDDILVVWHDLMQDLPDDRFAMLPGAVEVLDALKAKSIPMLIVSNKSIGALERELTHFGLRDYFEVVIGGAPDRSKRKPSPYPITKALEEVNAGRDQRGEKKLSLGNLWYIGDHMDDMGAARSDGLQRVIIGTKHREEIKQRWEGADPAGGPVYMDNLQDIKALVESLPNTRRLGG